MPLYEYDCLGCGTRFEALVYGSQRARCPSCDGVRLGKRLSAFAVGSGQPDPAPAGRACGACGDPRGPGACRSD
jgi:putative FmdB family regulatory protein